MIHFRSGTFLGERICNRVSDEQVRSAEGGVTVFLQVNADGNDRCRGIVCHHTDAVSDFSRSGVFSFAAVSLGIDGDSFAVLRRLYHAFNGG